MTYPVIAAPENGNSNDASVDFQKQLNIFLWACQETGSIVPTPINGRKMIRGAWSIAPVKKLIYIFFK
jgi:hypothetical protein